MGGSLRGRRSGRVLVANRLQQLEVPVVGVVLDDREHVPDRPEELDPGVLHGLAEQVVVRGRGQHGVEIDVGAPELAHRGHPARVEDVLHRVERDLQGCEVVVVPAGGGQVRGPGLQRDPQVEDVVHLGGYPAQPVPQRPGVLDDLLGHPDAAVRAAANLQQALGRQRPGSLAQGRPGDPQLLRELPLVRQPVARHVPARRHRPPDLLRGQLERRSHLDPAERGHRRGGGLAHIGSLTGAQEVVPGRNRRRTRPVHASNHAGGEALTSFRPTRSIPHTVVH